MEAKENFFRLKGKPVSPFSLTFLFILNFFLVFFSQSGSFNLDFFVAFSLIFLIFELNKDVGSLKVGNNNLKLTHITRNVIFLVTSVLLLTVVSFYFFGINPPTDGDFIGGLTRLERIAHLLFSMIVMLILYKTILIDFGILIAIVLFANLFYHIVLKAILEVNFNIDYLKFIFQGQDLRKEIQTLLNNTPNRSTPWKESSFTPRIIDAFLVFTGVLNTIFNTLYLIIFSKVVGKRMLNLSTWLSQIYLPRLLAWFFIINGILLWIYLQLYGILTVISQNSPYWERLVGEIIISGILGFSFIYLIQGFSILFAYIKEKNFLAQKLINLPVVVFISTFLALSLIVGMGLMVWVNLFLIGLTVVGFTDSWINYRKNYHYQNYLN